jgi:hypothetical protein
LAAIFEATHDGRHVDMTPKLQRSEFFSFSTLYFSTSVQQVLGPSKSDFLGSRKVNYLLARLNLCNIWNRELLLPMFLHLLDVTYFELIKKSGLNFEAFW